MINVIATAEGYYSSAIRKPGQKFQLSAVEDFSPSWMAAATKEDEKKVESVVKAKEAKRKLLIEAIQKDMSSKTLSEVAKVKKALAAENKKGSKGQADELV